jgi:hypothetical protein
MHFHDDNVYNMILNLWISTLQIIFVDKHQLIIWLKRCQRYLVANISCRTTIPISMVFWSVCSKGPYKSGTYGSTFVSPMQWGYCVVTFLLVHPKHIFVDKHRSRYLWSFGPFVQKDHRNRERTRSILVSPMWVHTILSAFHLYQHHFLFKISSTSIYMCCSSARQRHAFDRRHCGLARHFKTDPTETVALCFGYAKWKRIWYLSSKTPCWRADGSCLPEQMNRSIVDHNFCPTHYNKTGV